MKKSSILSVLAGAALLVATAAPALAGGALCVWTGSTDDRHPVISGLETTLKGTVMSTRTGLRYRWKYDNTNSYSPILPVTDPYALEAKFTYTGTVGTAKTATLQILGPTGTGVISSDTYRIIIRAADETTKRAIAIEEGLWFLHKSLKRYTTAAGHGGVLAAGANQSRSYDPGVVMIGQAFVDAGFSAAGSLDNPYTETVAQVANFVTERLGVMAVGAEDRTAGAAIDGWGVFFKDASQRGDEVEYGFGPALKFIATCGYTTEKPVSFDNDLNFTNTLYDADPVVLTDWTFQEIAQQMVDWIDWAQLDTLANDYWTLDEYGSPKPPSKVALELFPGSAGGWPYSQEGWNVDPATGALVRQNGGQSTYGDVAISYWMASGLQAAADSGLVVSDNVKSAVGTFATGRQRADGCFEFGPMENFSLIERSGAGLYLLKFGGVAGTPIANARDCATSLWDSNIYHAQQGHPNLDQKCFLEDETEVQCTSHWAPGGDPLGYWICNNNGSSCTWETLAIPNDFNLFAVKTVAEGAILNGFTDADFHNYRTFYRDLLWNNQNRVNGSWDDHGWVDGYSFGTAWAVSAMAALSIVQ